MLFMLLLLLVGAAEAEMGAPEGIEDGNRDTEGKPDGKADVDGKSEMEGVVEGKADVDGKSETEGMPEG
jgi:hypothetical protein